MWDPGGTYSLGKNNLALAFRGTAQPIDDVKELLGVSEEREVIVEKSKNGEREIEAVRITISSSFIVHHTKA